MIPNAQSWISCDQHEQMQDKLAWRLAERLHEFLKISDRASIALSGGSTPAPMLRVLGAQDIEWDRITVTLTDERRVPVDSDRSNQRMVQRTLFAGQAAKAARFIPLRREQLDEKNEVAAICVDLEREALPLNFAVLGMGEDMHTASLFPGARNLEAALAEDAPAALAMHAPGVSEHRITLSARVIAGAERYLMIKGTAKIEALERAVEIGDPLQAPILSVLDGIRGYWAP